MMNVMKVSGSGSLVKLQALSLEGYLNALNG